MITTALHFASVALNTDPVPKPIELTASQKYSILAEQGRHGQRIKSWVKKNYLFSYNMFERNSWEPCPIKPSHLRKWQHRINSPGRSRPKMDDDISKPHNFQLRKGIYKRCFPAK